MEALVVGSKPSGSAGARRCGAPAPPAVHARAREAVEALVLGEQIGELRRRTQSVAPAPPSCEREAVNERLWRRLSLGTSRKEFFDWLRCRVRIWCAGPQRKRARPHTISEAHQTRARAPTHPPTLPPPTHTQARTHAHAHAHTCLPRTPHLSGHGTALPWAPWPASRGGCGAEGCGGRRGGSAVGCGGRRGGRRGARVVCVCVGGEVQVHWVAGGGHPARGPRRRHRDPQARLSGAP